MNDANEVETLRARVADLETRLAQATSAPSSAHRPRRWRAAGSAVLIVLACVLAPLSVVSVWASTQLSDSDQYVETVAPLADDPAVQSAISGAVTREVFARLDVDGLTDQALTVLAERGDLPQRVASALPSLSTPIASGVEGFARDQVDEFLASERFADLWEELNRVAHEQVVHVLEGEQSGALSAQDDSITLNLAPIIEQVKQRLEEQGFALAGSIPAVNRSFVLVKSDSITEAQGFYRLLNTFGTWLPVIALALAAGGVALAADRRRALAGAALGVTSAMLVLGLVLLLARSWYVGDVPSDVLTPEAAGGVFDTLVRFLRTGMRALAILALVVAFGAFLVGPSESAARVRSAFAHGIGYVRGGAEAAGWSAGRAGAWTYAHKRALQVATILAAGGALVFSSRPSGAVVIALAVLVLVALSVIEFLGRPTTPLHEAAAAGAPGPRATSPGVLPDSNQPTMGEQPRRQ